MSFTTRCCPDAEFSFLANGVQVRDLNPQSETTVLQYFPYRAIQTVRYTYSRDDREGQITIWVASQGTPGAGGLSFRWRFPCSSTGEGVYAQFMEKLG